MIETLERLGEFSTVMQTRDEVEGLHNYLEFSYPSRIYIRLCKHGKCFLLLISKMKARKDAFVRKKCSDCEEIFRFFGAI